jgi:protein-S-isoprenylcysteine O-methyltransferase Ste14
MSALVWVLIAVGVILVLLVVFYLGRRRRSTRLRREFGPEYERTVD